MNRKNNDDKMEQVEEFIEIPTFFNSMFQRKYTKGGDQTRLKLYLKSVGEALDSMKQERSPLTYFLALMQSIREKEDAITNTTALQLVSIILDKVDEKILISKVSLFARVLTLIVKKYESNEKLVSQFISCAACLLKRQNNASWNLPETKELFGCLVETIVYPKDDLSQKSIRQIINILTLESGQGIAVMSAILEENFIKILDGKPEKTGKYLHLFEEALPYLTPKSIMVVSNLLLKIPKLGRDELITSTYKAFLNLFTMEKIPVKTESFGLILKALVGNFQKFEKSSVSFCPAVSIGLTKLIALDYENAKLLLPDAFTKLMTLFETSNKSASIPAMNALIKLVLEGIDNSMIKEAIDSQSTVLRALIEILKNGLNFRYAENLDLVFQVYAFLFKRIGRKSNPLLMEILGVIGTLRKPDFKYNNSLEKAMGAAISALGPVLILKMFPLELQDPDNRRQWLLPLLRDHACNTQLEFFLHDLLPVANSFKEMSAKAQGNLVKFYKTIYEQIWMCWPAFMLYAVDFDSRFNEKSVESLITLMTEEAEIKRIVCKGLIQVITKNQDIFSTKKVPEGLQYKVENAASALSILAKHSKLFIPSFFNLFAEGSEGDRNIIAKTINSMTSIISKKEVTEWFKNVIKKLLQAESEMSQDGISKEEYNIRQNRKHDMLDLAISMCPNLPEESVSLFYKIIQPYIQSEDSSVQKKGYRALSIICGLDSKVINAKDIFSELKKGLSICKQSSKKYRNACLMELVEKYDDISTILPQLMVEGILGQRDVGSKSRDSGRHLIVTLAKRYAFGPGVEEIDEVTEQQAAKLAHFIKNFLAGLGGQSVQMITGTIHCLGELIAVFKDHLGSVVIDVFNSVLLLIQYDDKVVLKEVLGFIRICLGILDYDFFLKFLPIIVQGLVSYTFREDNSSGDIKTQIKFLFERLVKKFTWEVLADLVEDPTQKTFIKNISKMLKRKKRRISHEDEDRTEYDEEYVEEGEDDPVDLMDPRYVGSVKKSRERRSEEDGITFEEKKGKLVINEIEEKKPGDKRKRQAEDVMEDDFNEDEIVEEKEETFVPSVSHSKPEKKQKTSNDKYGNEYKARKGTGGDMKRHNKPEPFAYIPLNPRQMNRRERGKDSAFSKFDRDAKQNKRK